MINETDLDWLARNVHVWAEDWTHVRKCPVHHEAKWMASLSPNAEYKDWRTKQQWLTRRAELQNKPGWDHEAVPAWATALAQDQDGEWKWLGDNVTQYVDGFTADKIRAQCKGFVLGSWRDTLEKRTEEFKPSIEEANRLAQEFKLFISIEDNQEQEMKQDNGWFERGELPPVGTECEALWNEGRMEYLRTKVFGVNEHGQPIHRFGEGPKKFEYQADPLVTILGTRVFRPIRTERDVLISVIIDEMNRYDTDAKLADAILEAGFRLGVK